MDKGGLKQSRFSTLKVFKFGKNAAQQAPPPLPPKDPGYLAARNRSLASLSPDSLPASPLSGDQYGASSSAVSLALPQQKQRSGLFKSKKPPTPTPNDDDENISMPWNFQHNVHVDEGFTGMPPSWNTSLQEAGFSEDEIAAIQQRRMPMPAALVKPAPRSTSLPKNQAGSSAASIHSEPRSTYSSPEPQSTYSSPKSGYRDYKPPPSPKSPPPMYNYEQPLPLNIVRGQPSAAYTGHARAESQQSSSSSHSGSYSSRSRSPSPQQAPAPKLNAKNLTLDLAPLGDAATDSTWSEGVLSATPWSASASNTSHPKPSPPISASSASFLPTLSPPSSATSPLFTLTGPRGERGRSPTFEDVPGAEVHADFSPTTAYYGLSSPGDARTPTSGGSGSSGGGGLAYDEERDDEIFGIVRSPAIASSVASPNSASYATYSDHLTVGAPGNGGSSNRDSDATMLGVPPSAGVVRHVTTVARRAVAEVVAAKQSPAAPAPTRVAAPSRPPPASPQSSHFTSSSGSGSVEGEGSHSGDSSENQMYDYAEDDERGYGREPETPRTEVNEDGAQLFFSHFIEAANEHPQTRTSRCPRPSQALGRVRARRSTIISRGRVISRRTGIRWVPLRIISAGTPRRQSPWRR
ncbi:hypothetical protein C8R46DRAFT_1106173 [Mycena filopes]|nr:hypothetical protein C8R46DRAFT_1106173 [Mycena filopes]